MVFASCVHPPFLDSNSLPKVGHWNSFHLLVLDLATAKIFAPSCLSCLMALRLLFQRANLHTHKEVSLYKRAKKNLDRHSRVSLSSLLAFYQTSFICSLFQIQPHPCSDMAMKTQFRELPDSGTHGGLRRVCSRGRHGISGHLPISCPGHLFLC